MSLGSDQVRPPIFNIEVVCPSRGRDVVDATPIEEGGPNTFRETALEKKARRRFLDLIAKGTKITIWPSPML